MLLGLGHLLLLQAKLLLLFRLSDFPAEVAVIVREVPRLGLRENLLERAMLVLQRAHRSVLRTRHGWDGV